MNGLDMSIPPGYVALDFHPHSAACAADVLRPVYGDIAEELYDSWCALCPVFTRKRELGMDPYETCRTCTADVVDPVIPDKVSPRVWMPIDAAMLIRMNA